MDTSKIVKEQRNLILSKYGFRIQVEHYGLCFRYTIATRNGGGFTASVYHDSVDEIDTILQLIRYMDTVPYKISYAEAHAYYDCLVHCNSHADSGYWSTAKTVDYIREKYNKARNISVESGLSELGIENVDSLYCNHILGLEASRKTLPQLYSELKWLKETAELKQIDYESLIPFEVYLDESDKTPTENE